MAIVSILKLADHACNPLQKPFKINITVLYMSGFYNISVLLPCIKWKEKTIKHSRPFKI